MNFEKLFEIQAGLDEHIIQEKGLERQDLLDKKILALQVELGELAQEVQDEWKFWKLDFKRNTKKILEEYVDCLHFVLSIGLEHQEYLEPIEYQDYIKENDNITEQFHQVFKSVSDYEWYRDETNYYEMACQVLGLGEMLGFTEEQIEQAYLEKNKINHERQNTGY